MSPLPHPGRGEPQLALPPAALAALAPSPHRGWHHPRNLPHFDARLATQMVTYRLADALPRDIAKRRADEAGPDRTLTYRRRIESSLDAGHGSCCLRHPTIAAEIVSTWKHFDPERYRLRAWVVMPNHVHVLFQMTGGWSLAKIVQSWKSWTGKAIAKRQGELGLASPRGWQREYWDRYVRDESHFLAAIDYIHNNPVMAGLCRTTSGWRWSSLGEARPSSPHDETSPTSKDPLDDAL